MADTTVDALGRTINSSFNDLRDALLKDLGQQKENTQKKSENTDEIKKLNDNLHKIIGTDLINEIKALGKLVKKVSECCESVSKEKGKRSKSKSDLVQEGKDLGKGIAEALGKSAARDIKGDVASSLKEAAKAFDTVADKTLTFGEVLERSQTRFGRAFQTIGRHLKSDFGAIANVIKAGGQWIYSGIQDFVSNLYNTTKKTVSEMYKGVKAYVMSQAKEFKEAGVWAYGELKNKLKIAGLAVASGFVIAGGLVAAGGMAVYNGFKKLGTELYSTTMKTISSGYNVVKDYLTPIGQDLKAIGQAVGGWVSDNVKYYGGKFFNAIGSLSSGILGWTTTFLGKLATPLKAIGGWAMKYISPLGKAIGGTVKDLFRMGKPKTASKATDDLLKPPVRKGMTGHKPPDGGGGTGRTGGGPRGKEPDLCRCICKCIGKLMGVSKDIAKSSKATAASTRAAGRSEMHQEDLIQKQLEQKKEENKGESKEDLIRDWLKQEHKKRWDARGAAAKSKILGAAANAQNLIFGGKPIESLLNGVSTGLSKTAGKVIEMPLGIIGDMISKSTIPVFSALGPIVSAFGAALGGLAEGLVHLVLTPLIKQVEFMGDATRAMFVSTGATFAPPTLNAGKKANGEEWSDLAKTMMEVDRNMESMSKTLDVLGTKMNDVVETGQDFETIQKHTLKNFKRGIRDNRELNKVTKTGLQTAYLLDANAENTADMFANWHQNLGMSSTDLRSMQRGMTQIAKSTGLVGDNLIDAAKSAHDFMDNMRKAGTLTAESSRSLIEMMARAKLTGTEGAAKSFAKIMSQGRLRGNLSGHEQTLAAIGGGSNTKLIDAITFGTVQGNKELEMEFANNLEDWLKAQVGGDPNKGLEENMKKMSAEQISKLSYLTQQLFGMGAKEFQLQIKNMQKGAQSFSQNIAEIERAGSVEAMSLDKLRAVADKEIGWREKFDKALNDAGGDTSKALSELLNMRELPLEMRKQFEGQLNAQQVAYQRQHLFITTGADLMDKFNNILEDNTEDVGSSLTKLAAGNKDFREYLGKIGTDAAKGGEAIEKVLEDQAKRLMMEADKFGMGEDISKLLPDPADIKKALKDNDKAALKIIADRFARAKGMVETGGMKNTSPMELIKQYLNQIAGMFNELMQAGLKEVLPMLMHAIKDFSKAPFWKAFKEGDLRKGFELFGEYIQSIVPNVKKAMEEIGSLADSPGFRKFLTTLIDGLATAAGPILDALGKTLRDKAPDLMNVFDDIKKFITDTDWKAVATGFGAIAAGFVKIAEFSGKIIEILGPKGLLAVGLAGLVLLIGPLATVAGIVTVLTAALLGLDGSERGFINFMYSFQTGLLEINRIYWQYIYPVYKEIIEITKSIWAIFKDMVGGMLGFIIENWNKFAGMMRDISETISDKIGIKKIDLAFDTNALANLEAERREKEKKGEDAASIAARKLIEIEKEGKKLDEKLFKDITELNKREKEKADKAKEMADKAKEMADAAALKENLGKASAELLKVITNFQEITKSLKNPKAEEVKDTKAKYFDSISDNVKLFFTAKSLMAVRQNRSDSMKEQLDKVSPDITARLAKGDAPAQITDELFKSGKFKSLDEVNKFMSTLDEYGKNLKEMTLLKSAAEYRSNQIRLNELIENKKNLTALIEAARKEGKEPFKVWINRVEKDTAEIAELAAKGIEPGSIYTHDIYAEEIQTNILESVNSIGNTMSMVNDMLMRYMDQELNEAMKTGTVTARVPVDAEQELRKREAELRSNATDMSATEANTGATAANTRATAKAVNALGKLMAKFLASSRNGLSDLSGPDYSIDTFFDEALSTSWHSANPDRQPGLDVDGN